MSTQFSIYTPSLHDIDDLEARLVGAKRRHAEQTVSMVRRSVLNGGSHHILFVGPRGIGKTHVVSVCFHRLRNDEELRPRLALAWIREEHYGIASAADLLGRVMEAVRTDNPGADVPEGASPEAELRALARNRHVVIFAENLDDLFRRIGLHGQQVLRAVVQETGAVSLVATTPSLFPGVSAAESPFYGSFDTTHIDEMSLDEAHDLLLRVATLREDSDLIAALHRPETRRRLQVIQALAGGHPRIWMLFADSLSVGDIDELVPLFLKMLDDLTPYYQDRMRGLEGDQERIVTLLCDQPGALSVGDIAERCGLEQRVASTAVGRLEGKGFVRRLSHTGRDRRRAYYELREPLLRLCLQVKESRGKPVQLIVEFLRGWYDRANVWDLLARVPAGSLAIDYLRAAFLEAPPTIGDLNAKLSPADFHRRVDGFIKVYPDDIQFRIFKALYMYFHDDAEGAIAVLDDDRGPFIDLLRLVASVQAGLTRGPEVVDRLRSYVDRDAVDGASLVLAATGLENLHDDDGALAALTRSAQLESEDYVVHDARAILLLRLDRLDEAIHAIDEARVGREPSISNRILRSNALLRLGRLDELMTESQALVSVAPDLSWARLILGLTQLSAGQTERALASFDEAHRLDPDADEPLELLGEALALLVVPGDGPGTAAILDRLDESVKRRPDSSSLRETRARVLQRVGRHSEARDDLAHAAALEPQDAYFLFGLAEAELRLQNWDAFTAAIRRGLEIGPDHRADNPTAYCSLLVSKPDRVSSLIEIYQSHNAIAALGQGLVASIRSVVESDAARAVEWLSAWQDAGAGREELIIPLRILAAAVAWKVEGDDAYLLRLPAEERAVLEPMLQHALARPG